MQAVWRLSIGACLWPVAWSAAKPMAMVCRARTGEENLHVLAEQGTMAIGCAADHATGRVHRSIARMRATRFSSTSASATRSVAR